MPKTILSAKNIKKTYLTKGLFNKHPDVEALKDVSFDLGKRETLALVGESGCGKSTLAKVLMQIEAPTAGSIELFGKPAGQWDIKEYRSHIQMIFQDPYSSLNPRKKAREIIGEPLAIAGKFSKRETEERVRNAIRVRQPSKRLRILPPSQRA